MNRQLPFLKKVTVLFSVSLLLSFTDIKAQTLNEGDLAVIGWNALTDEVHIVTLVDIPAGTEIKITDKGWDQSINAFTVPPNPPTSSDGVVTWTLSGAMPAGTVLELFLGGADGGTTLTDLTTSTNLTLDIVVSGFFVNDAMLGTGDQIFIYQGADGNPFFIFGMNNSSGPVDANNWNNNDPLFALRDSNLPNGTGSQNALTNGVNAIGLRTAANQEDNVQYTGPTTTTDRNTWLARITDIANWDGTDDDEEDLENPITNAPEPIVDIAPPNNPPTDIALSNTSVDQSTGVNAVVGTLTSTDPDASDTHSYTLATGAGDDHNGSFNLDVNSGVWTLRANNAAALVAGIYSVRIQTDDNNGGTYQEAFGITVVDDIAPTVNNVAVPANGTYPTGQNLDFTVNVSEAVAVTGTPRIALTIGSTSVNAIYHAGGSTATGLVFRYMVQSGATDTDGITVGASIDLNGGTITDGADLPLTLTLNSVGSTTGVLVDGVAPSVTGVDVPGDDAYALGEPLSFTVNFNENMVVNTTGGNPRIPLTIGTNTRYATYVNNPVSDALLFTYTVVAGDNDTDGISVGTHIELNGGAIQDVAGNAAALTLNAIGATNDVRVDGVAPTVSTFSPANGSADMEPDANLLVTFSERIAFGTGNIVIYDDAATPIATINVQNHGGQLSIADEVLTINPTADLLELTDYYVHIGNDAIHDLVGNAYLGINDNTTWAFTVTDVTAPSGYTVSIDQAEITLANQTALSFTFSGAEVGATFGYTITSSGGGTPVTGSGSVSTANQQVSGIDVSGLPNGTLTLNATLTDNIGNAGIPATDNVTKAVNHPPVITTSGGVTTFTESVTGDPEPEIIDPALTVSDVDNGTLVSATVTITGNFQSGEDVLDFVNDGGNTGDIDGNYASGVLTLTSPSATATLAEWQTALRSVTYSNTSTTPNTANRTISFVANDGTDDGAATTKVVVVQAVNNAPVIDNLDGDEITFTEKGPAILLDAGGNATVSDSDSPDFNGGNLTVSIAANGAAGEDGLGIRDEGFAAGEIGVSGGDVYYGGTPIGLLTGGTGGIDLVVTFLPSSTPAVAQALIRNLTYGNFNTANPSPDPRTIHVTLYDGDGATSAFQEVTVNITLVNDAPVLTTSGGTVTFTEPEDGDPEPVTIDPGLTVTDPDNATLASATVHITGSFESGEDLLAFVNDGSMDNISGSYDAGTGILTLTSAGATATRAEWEAALRAVTYSNSSHDPSTAVRTISFVANDGTTDSSPATRDINIVAVNTAPVAMDDEIPVTEDIPATGNALTNDSDVEGNALTASLTIAPVNGTVVLNADGSLTYTPNSNYNGLDSLQYQACDNGMPTRCDTAWVYFNVEAVNDAPTITAPATLAADEDIRTPLTGISFADVDAGGADVMVTVEVASGTLSATSGGGVIVSGSETETLTLVGSITDLNAFIAADALHFTTALHATSDVTLTVTIDDDGNTGSDPGSSGTDDSEAATATITLVVTALNDAPVNTVPVSQTVDQNGSLVFSPSNGNAISVSDVDAGGGTIRVSLAATNGLLTLSGITGLNFLAGDGTDDGTVTFDGTLADINQALNGLLFVPTSGYNGPASLQITTDDLGLTGSDGPKTDTDLINITVNPIEPVVTAVGSATPDGLYKIGDVISLTVTFDQSVMVDEAGGSPGLLMETGDTDREAAYTLGSGSNTLTFNYTVQASDVSADLDYTSTAALVLNGATIQNTSGNDAVLDLPILGVNSIAGQHDLVIDGVAPAVTSVDVPANDYYRDGDVLTFTVHMDDEVIVNGVGGAPYLEVTVGTTDVEANYTGGSGTAMLTFGYTVQAEDEDLDGIALGSDIVLSGGTLHDNAGNEAMLILNGVAPTDHVFVYSRRPSVALSTEAATPVNAPFTVMATFSEAVAGFTLADITASNGTLSDLETSDNIVYTFQVTPAEGGNVELFIAADVVVNIADNGNDASNTLSIQFNEIITGIVLKDSSFVYDGTAKALEVEGALPEGTTVSYTDNSRTDVGTQEVTATVSGDNYETLVLTADLTITPANVTGITLKDSSFVYDGTAKSLTIDGTLPGGATVSYADNSRTDVGTQEFTATVSGDNYETLVLTADLTITPANVTGITLKDSSFVYDGTAKSLTIDGTLPEGTTVSYTDNSRTDVGTQEVTATVSGDNYETLVLTADLTITPATITGITLKDSSFVYDGTARSLTIDGTLSEGTTVSYTDNSRTDVGTQEVTATISGDNYETLVLTADLTVTPANVTGITLKDSSFVYDGTARSLTIDGTLPEGTTVSYTDNSRTDVGTQEVTATISGDNYETLVLTADLTITPATITGITLKDSSFVYDGTARSLTIDGTLPEGTSVSYADNSRTDAGTQEVTATVSGDNYDDLVLTANLTVTPAARTISFPALPEKAYGDADFAAGATASSGEATTYTSSDASVVEITTDGQLHITGVGEATITATVPENSNYSNRPQASQTLVVRKASQTITFTAPAEVDRGAGTIQLHVSASSGLPVTLSIDDEEVATLSGTALNILRLGTVHITATQAGDANHEPAEPVKVAVRVADPTLDLPIRVHKAVSPNGDGINEYLIIEAIKDYPENRVRIVNRNGTVVWEASGYNNGTVAFRGIGTGQNRVPAGTYFYIAEIKVGSEWKYEKGWFVLRY
ncbi:MAG TPA: Ig-like domain-containing protein [Parapedobacter sp.]|uniref:T9SS type B sorting domain-containing protein n=1 Tax=Parapedobacter sp. TaxID=1958893 RepID=UPI002C45C857|nr:Ig-like domain-containing protein [Parapedobacter sp.]HWK55829.1 Ig-like domain-containing protein [Parapedobacter sp.]